MFVKEYVYLKADLSYPDDFTSNGVEIKLGTTEHVSLCLYRSVKFTLVPQDGNRGHYKRVHENVMTVARCTFASFLSLYM